jgi:hypothetical protein
MTTITKKGGKVPNMLGNDAAAEIADVMQEMAGQAAGSIGGETSGPPAINAKASPETQAGARAKASAGGIDRSSLDVKLDPIKGTPAEKVLDTLNGAGLSSSASPAEQQQALQDLQTAAGQISPDQALALMKFLGLKTGKTLDDPKTQQAIKQLQEAAGLNPTGKLDLETLLALVEAANNKRNFQHPSSNPMMSPQPSGSAGAGGSSGAASGPASYVPRRTGGGDGGGDGSAGATGGASSPGTAPTGTLKTNQQEAYNEARKEGLSPTAAKALVANMTGESLSKPNDNHWDVHHMSQGIVQWDPSRSAAIKAQFGKEPKDMTVAEQTKAAIWEMKTKYPQTFAALQNGNNPQAMISTLVRDYERPGNPGAAISQRMGNYNQLGYLDSAG